jgi:hypothetical protein
MRTQSDQAFAVQNSTGKELLARVAQAEPIAQQLRAVAAGESAVAFRMSPKLRSRSWSRRSRARSRKHSGSSAPPVRSQELLYESLLNWAPRALFLPEAEFAAVENILPDPEITAERLSLLSKVGREAGPHLVVTTRAALDQPAPKLRSLKAASLRLKRGAGEPMEKLVESLSGAGYERVAQVTARGQFAVRAAFSISTRGRRSCRCARSFSAMTSSRCVSSTSIRKRRSAICKRSTFSSVRRKTRAAGCATTSRKITCASRSNLKRTTPHRS